MCGSGAYVWEWCLCGSGAYVGVVPMCSGAYVWEWCLVSTCVTLPSGVPRCLLSYSPFSV